MQYVIDASSSMRARLGQTTRLDAARAALRALDRELARDDSPAGPALWAYGATSPRLERDCSDIQLLARGRGAAFERGLNRLSPSGVSPLVFALQRVLDSTPRSPAEAWVLFTDGGDNCGADLCEWATEALALSARPRIYVVGLALADEDVRALRCLTDPTAGYLLSLDLDSDWVRPVSRIADLIRNRGTLRVEARLGGGEAAGLQGRVFRASSDAFVRTIRAGRDEELPGGIYRVVLETLPPTELDGVLIVAGEERVVRLDDLAQLRTAAYSSANEALPAYAAVAPEDPSGEERYFPAGTPVYVRPGRYRLTLEVGDSVALRGTVEVAAGEVRTVSTGGTGYVRAHTPGLLAPPEVEVELQDYATGSSTAVQPWTGPVEVPAGEYRAVVRTLPRYVEERFTVAPAETSSLVVPGLGTLQIDLTDAAGRPLTLPVTLLRPESPGVGGAEPTAGGVIGTFLSGVTQAVLAGTYDLILETVPSRVERGVRVTRGAAHVVPLSLPPGDSGGKEDVTGTVPGLLPSARR